MCKIFPVDCTGCEHFSMYKRPDGVIFDADNTCNVVPMTIMDCQLPFVATKCPLELGLTKEDKIYNVAITWKQYKDFIANKYSKQDWAKKYLNGDN